MIKILSRILPLKLRLEISKAQRRFWFRKRISKIVASRDGGRMFFVLNIPSHGNMGDQLIAYAIEKLMAEQFPLMRTEFFTTGELECGVKLLAPAIKPDDIIFITGGGFLGDIYPDEERRFHDIMRLYGSNKIILFPQTFTYDVNGETMRCAIDAQQCCDNLVIATREQKSYEIIKTHFTRATVLLMPDVATHLNFSYSRGKRDGILICSRSDKEMTGESAEMFSVVNDWTAQNRIKVAHFDTQVNYAVSSSMRKGEIDKIIDKVSRARLIITDRLHGMIYAIITGTPVIAIDNSTHKVSGAVYSWFKGIPYVRLCQYQTQLKSDIEDLYKMGGQIYDNTRYKLQLQKLISYVEA